MGPVAQLVFKTSAVVQPTARSVRLRRRSVGSENEVAFHPRGRLRTSGVGGERAKGGRAMSTRVEDALSTRTVVIRFPGGATEYWLTDQVFAVGDTLRRSDGEWIVADVLGVDRTEGHEAIVLRNA